MAAETDGWGLCTAKVTYVQELSKGFDTVKTGTLDIVKCFNVLPVRRNNIYIYIYVYIYIYIYYLNNSNHKLI